MRTIGVRSVDGLRSMDHRAVLAWEAYMREVCPTDLFNGLLRPWLRRVPEDRLEDAAFGRLVAADRLPDRFLLGRQTGIAFDGSLIGNVRGRRLAEKHGMRFVRLELNGHLTVNGVARCRAGEANLSKLPSAFG